MIIIIMAASLSLHFALTKSTASPSSSLNSTIKNLHNSTYISKLKATVYLKGIGNFSNTVFANKSFINKNALEVMYFYNHLPTFTTTSSRTYYVSENQNLYVKINNSKLKINLNGYFANIFVEGNNDVITVINGVFTYPYADNINTTLKTFNATRGIYVS